MEDLSAWTPWLPLRGSWLGGKTPHEAGLYRVRRVGFDGIDYLRRTGRNLRFRVGKLRGVFEETMPYCVTETAYVPGSGEDPSPREPELLPRSGVLT